MYKQVCRQTVHVNNAMHKDATTLDLHEKKIKTYIALLKQNKAQ